MLNSQAEQLFTVAVHVVTIQEPLPMVGNDGAQSELAVDQRQVTQIVAVISPQQIEGVEPGLATPE